MSVGPAAKKRLLTRADDQSLLTGLQAIPQWNAYFGSPSGNFLGLIAAAIFIPGTVFGYPADWICSYFGRKMCIYVGSVLIIAGGIWNGLSQNTTQFIVCEWRALHSCRWR